MWIKLLYWNYHGLKKEKGSSNKRGMGQKEVKRFIWGLKISQTTLQDSYIADGIFTASLASWVLCISRCFKSSPFPEGLHVQSFWSHWIHVCTCVFTHHLSVTFTDEAEGAELSTFLRCCLDCVVKMMCTVACFTRSQYWELWKLLFLRTTSVLIKRSTVFLKPS